MVNDIKGVVSRVWLYRSGFKIVAGGMQLERG
jgi:hypothetical protein